MLDLRYPTGFFFAISGLLLVILGFASNPQAPMTSANVDLYTGLIMLVFGGLMLGLAVKAHRKNS
jgi:hypothetical protein